MAKIDPMYNLVNTILDDKEVIIFLGSGSSMEGKQGGKYFPSFDELIDRILEKFGFDLHNKKNRFNNFQTAIKKWENEKKLASRLNKYLDGEPGLAHYYLATLSIALFSESNALLYLTTNFDDLMKKSFKDLERNTVRKFNTIDITLRPDIKGSEFQEIATNIEVHNKEGRPVILKLFGDLNSQNPIFSQEKMKFEPEVEKKLIEWLKKPMIVIGYSFSDKIIEEFLLAARSPSPVFLVNPSEKIPASIKKFKRVQHVKTKFNDFVFDFLGILKKVSPINYEKFEKISVSLPSIVAYPNFESIKKRIEICSKASIIRAEEKLPKIKIDGVIKEFVPIERRDTSPNFQRFVNSEKPLLAVIGDSGSGKSTLFYKVAKNQSKSNQNFVNLFYDVHHLQSTGGLIKRLENDFGIQPGNLESLFKHLDNLLLRANKKLLITIDGLNESINIDPSMLKIEIEDTASILPISIKIAYSCRTIYWNSYIKVNSPISPVLYLDSKEFILYYYSEKETQKAFELYQNLYKFEGTFNALKNEFKEKIRDPLMLRMLAEGYQKEKLPTFAPAVKIFKNYEDVLRKKFEGTVLIDFLEELVFQKLMEVEKNPNVTDQFDKKTIRRNTILSNITLQQVIINKKSPIILLEDEGILSSLDKEKSIYRFIYDRFFEYLLGKEIGAEIEIQIQEKPGGFNKENFIKILSEKIIAFHRIHFSFLQALKSEIIRHNIDDSKGIWSIFDSQTLKSLINNFDAAIVNFTKEVLRELTFESEKDILAALKGVKDDELSWKLLALDIAGDSPKIKPILIEGLFSGEKHFIRRCVQILATLNEDPKIRKDYEELILLEIKNLKKFQPKHAAGLIYYTATIFSAEDRMGNDPFLYVKTFWGKILSSIRDDFSKVKLVINHEFTRILKDEGTPFFGSNDYGDNDMVYLWKGMSDDERRVALKMIPLIINTDTPLDSDSQEIINFFGSAIQSWKKRKLLDKSWGNFGRFEYVIAQWILIQRSQERYEEIRDMLDRFTNNGFWLTIDFALCTMKYILELIHYGNEEIINDGFLYLKKWTERFEKENEKFFDVLEKDKPFEINFNPLEQASRIEAINFTPKEGPISILAERLTSNDARKVRMALLCTRGLWSDHPRKVLGTIELVVNHKDPTTKEWFEKVIKEIYLVYPRLVEEFFWRNNMNPTRIQSIKYRDDVLESTGVVREGYSLYKALFLRSKERRVEFANWYKEMFKSQSFENYCNKLTNFLLKEVMN